METRKLKILYVAKHNSGDNDDEGAIAHALGQLGHSVTCVPQAGASIYFRNIMDVPPHDFLLFHKWEDVNTLKRVSHIPLVGWYFDLVQSDDFAAGAGVGRVEWCEAVEPHCIMMCHTDGDWAELNPDKRVHLCQGMDERVAGYGIPHTGEVVPPILFVGGVRYSKRRATLIDELKARYGNQFQVRGEHARTRLHGRALADLYANTKVLIAPDNATDGWWSNRVWNTLGLGGFLIHPQCAKLENYYTHTELMRYANRNDLFDKIDMALESYVTRCLFRDYGHEATMERHTYRHRCRQLIGLVEERL